MPDNDKQSPRGIPVSGEVRAEERKALDLNPQGRKPTKLKREIRIAIFSILCVVFLAFVFGVVKRGQKNTTAAAPTAETTKPVDTGRAEAQTETSDLEQEAEMHRRAAAQAALKGQGPGTGQGAANGDVASDLNLPPTEVSQRGAQNGANAANRPLTPAEQQILEELALDKAARDSALSKGGAQFQKPPDTGSQQLSDLDKMRQELETRVAAESSASPGGSRGSSTGPDDPNRQTEKNDFLRHVNQDEQHYVPAPRQPALSRYEIKAGWDIPATLEQAMNSDLPGEVRGIVRENVYDTVTGHYLLIPQGSRVIGYYNSHVTYGQNGLQVVWTRLIYPDGSSIDLGGLNGQDVQGLSGFRDKVDNHYKRLVGFALLTSLFAAGIELTQQGSTTNNSYYPSNQQLVTQAVGQQLGEMGIQITNRNLNIQPTIKIPLGYRFTIRVRKDLIFDSPYREEQAVWH